MVGWVDGCLVVCWADWLAGWLDRWLVGRGWLIGCVLSCFHPLFPVFLLVCFRVLIPEQRRLPVLVLPSALQLRRQVSPLRAVAPGRVEQAIGSAGDCHDCDGLRGLLFFITFSPPDVFFLGADALVVVGLTC